MSETSRCLGLIWAILVKNNDLTEISGALLVSNGLVWSIWVSVARIYSSDGVNWCEKFNVCGIGFSTWWCGSLNVYVVMGVEMGSIVSRG